MDSIRSPGTTARWQRGGLAGAILAAILPSILVPVWMIGRRGSLVPDGDFVFPVLLPSGAIAVSLSFFATYGMARRGLFPQETGAATVAAGFGLLLALLAASRDLSFTTVFVAVLPSFGSFLVAGILLIDAVLPKRNPWLLFPGAR